MLWRPSEMKNDPPRITQRDKLTLSIQILAQTLNMQGQMCKNQMVRVTVGIHVHAAEQKVDAGVG